MKQWPEDNKTVTFSDLVTSVRECVDFHYRLSRKNTVEPMNYQGYDIGSSVKATSLSPDEALSLEQLDYDLTVQGRDAMDTIIGIAIQLGVEQGRRIEHENVKLLELMNTVLLAAANKSSE